MPNRKYIVILAVALLWIVAPGEIVQAGVTVPMSLETMADHSGQVISGIISEVHSYWADVPRRIESEIILSGVEYHKGSLPQSGDTFKLIVPGGKVGDVAMHIGCAPTFSVGDRWLLFLLPSYKTFPVVGVSQGSFRIRPDNSGIQRVYGNSGAPILAIDEGRIVEGNVASSESTLEHVRSRHPGEPEIVEVASPDVKAMEYGDFVKAIRPVLDRSRSHELNEPAGRRIVFEYTPVPIIRGGNLGDASHAGLSERARSAVRSVDMNHRGQAGIRSSGRGR